MSNLVGTGLNQVPTNGMLGGLAYQSPYSASIKDLDLRDLSKIKSEIADTAVDVFVYDTSKDSDGGAWRKRTQHTSWYNETLNTATRGSRKEFPAVAVIVAESSKVTIYDGDDPDMPMWMEFISTGGQYGAIYDGRTVISLVAKNGEISFVDSVDSVIHWNFIADTIKSTAASGSWNSQRNIAGRNPSDSTNLWSNYNSGRQLVGYPLNDVAVTVLPNAPIDDATGLPVPTIAVATNAGVSVIKDDGTIVDLTGYIHNTVDFYGKILAITFEGYSDVYYGEIPSADVSALSWTNRMYSNGSTGTILLNSNNDKTVVQTSEKSSAIGSQAALLLMDEDVNAPSQSMLAFVESDYNTGWMHGDIKGAFLSDTSTTNRDADTENLITGQKHDYESNTTESWSSQSSASATYDASNGVGGSACVLLTSTGGSNVWNSITFTGLTANTNYTLRFSAKNSATAGTVSSLSLSSAAYNTGTIFLSTSYTNTAQNTYEDVIMPFNSGAFTEVRLNVYVNNGSGGNLYLDEFYLTEAEADRSVNNNGLAVVGTITKTAVATGADLVGYSFGNNNANYLEQPHNTSMDFGTGDFSIMFWYKIASADMNEFNSFLDNGFGGSEAEYFSLGLYDPADGTYPGQWIFRTRDSSTNNNLFSGGSWYDDVWHCGVFLRRGATKEIWMDGNLLVTQTDDDDITTGRALRIGARSDGSRGWDGSAALLRISATAPSAEQIKKIYEDEKVLFQENAQATLYGSSDAVTVLAYDDDEETLYVGTSSGRSDFRGLRRINNTTTAVTTAISASNGLVAEQ